jgi:hypothetical protein
MARQDRQQERGKGRQQQVAREREARQWLGVVGPAQGRGDVGRPDLRGRAGVRLEAEPDHQADEEHDSDQWCGDRAATGSGLGHPL